MSRAWHMSAPDPASWKPVPGQTRNSRTTEQDQAADGRAKRYVKGSGALSSVALRLQPKGRSIYAYLRWSESGKTRERFLCEVRESSRAKNLESAWERARKMGLLMVEPPAGAWSADEGVRAVMQANKSRDTTPELLLRRALWHSGLRFRVNYRPLRESRRTCDIAFPGRQVAVFVDGCYWHSCPEHCRPARTNSQFWTTKLAATVRRDREMDEMLRSAGWLCVRIWEHEPPAEGLALVKAAIKTREHQELDAVRLQSGA